MKTLREIDDEMIVDEESMAYQQEVEKIITSAEKLFQFWADKDGRHKKYLSGYSQIITDDQLFQ